jgi:ankyrin repeat protein
MKDTTSSLREIARSSRTGNGSLKARSLSTVGSTVFRFDQDILRTEVYQTNGQHVLAKRQDVNTQALSKQDPPAIPRTRTRAPTFPMVKRLDTNQIPLNLSSSTLAPDRSLSISKSDEISFASGPLPIRPSLRPISHGLAATDYALFPSHSSLHSRTKSESSKSGIWASIKNRRSRANFFFADRSPVSSASSATLSPGSRRGRRRSENDFNRSIDLMSNANGAVPLIVKAAQEGSVHQIEEYLDQGNDIEEPALPSQRTALAVAAHCGNDDIVAVLLQHRANLQVVDAFGMTPLHLAASRGHYRVVELLLHDRASIDPLTYDARTPLRLASDEGFEEVAILLLRHNAKVNARDSSQLTALHAAAKAGDVAMVNILVAQGADVEAKDASFMAAIHYAASRGFSEIVEILLNNKAPLDCCGRASMTPLMFACAAGHEEVVKLLIEKKASLKTKADGDLTALHWASHKGHADIVSLLLQKRSAIEPRTFDGQTPLHVATYSGCFSTAELLVRKGANIEAHSDELATPLHHACQVGHLDIAQLLISSGARIEAKNGAGRRPLHLATIAGSTGIAERLVSQGAAVDARDSDGERPLSLACAGGHLELVKLLLNHNAAMRCKFKDGQSNEDSPLCVAAKHGHYSIALELIVRGASVRQKDERNWPPLRYAAYHAHPDVVDLLINTGASVVGLSAGGWGFDVTASRIGFASSDITEERKLRVLKLLVNAEEREKSFQDNSMLSTQAYRPERDGVVEADDRTTVPASPTRSPPPRANTTRAPVSRSTTDPNRMMNSRPQNPSRSATTPSSRTTRSPRLSIFTNMRTSNPTTAATFSSLNEGETTSAPSVEDVPAPPTLKSPPASLPENEDEGAQSAVDRLRALRCQNCKRAGKVIADLKCNQCRSVVVSSLLDIEENSIPLPNYSAGILTEEKAAVVHELPA